MRCLKHIKAVISGSLSLGVIGRQQSWMEFLFGLIHNILHNNNNGLGQLDGIKAFKVKNPGVDHNSFLTDGSISISVIEKMAHLLVTGE